jgi:hypothetical protein
MLLRKEAIHVIFRFPTNNILHSTDEGIAPGHVDEWAADIYIVLLHSRLDPSILETELDHLRSNVITCSRLPGISLMVDKAIHQTDHGLAWRGSHCRWATHHGPMEDK